MSIMASKGSADDKREEGRAVPAEGTRGERVAKAIARAGLGSRRQAETWIAAGRVAINGAIVATPAINVTTADRVTIDGKPLPARERTRLFLYHKPRGLMTTNTDPEGRPTIFDALPRDLPRLVSIGRLDLNTEGLLLLTNDGGLARALELPQTGWLRRYRVRAHGRVAQRALDDLRSGIEVDGVRYGPIEASVDREQRSNVWLTFAMREGKKREIRNVLGALGLQVTRLIRISFGPFQLGDLAAGHIEEVVTRTLREQIGERIASISGADFSAPVVERRPGEPPRGREPIKRARPPRDRESNEPRDAGDAAHPRGNRKHQPRFADTPNVRRSHVWRDRDTLPKRRQGAAHALSLVSGDEALRKTRAPPLTPRKGRRVLIEQRTPDADWPGRRPRGKR
jgi:23S rRNA pseudouridine2605 synthase